MQELHNSDFLSKLISKATTGENGNSAPFTAERLVIAAIESLKDQENPLAYHEKMELMPFHDFFIQHETNINRAKIQLKSFVLSQEGTTYSDILYMQQKMLEAKIEAKKRNLDEVTADIVLLGILHNPSKAIKNCFEQDKVDIEESIEEDEEKDTETSDSMSLMEALKKAKEDHKSLFGNKTDDAEESDDSDGGLLSPKEQGKKTNEELAALALQRLIKRAAEQALKSDDRRDEDTPTHGEPAFGIEDLLSDRREDDGDLEPISPKDTMTSLVEIVKQTRAALLERIYGQDNAVSVFTNGYFQGELVSLIDEHRSRPRATFLFAGPPGVGKTYLAETAAEVLKLPYKRFDMSEYSDKESTIPLCGSDGVYKDSQQGVLTSFVSKNPKCILLFDEIEKAHINAIHLFLQILDAGRLTDAKTRKEVSFRDTICIFTTNAGKKLYEDSETEDLSGLSRKVILKALEKDVNPETGNPFFPAAICSRFASGNVVMFNHMSAHNLRDIAKSVITRQIQNLEHEVGIKAEVDENVYTALLLAEGGTADARMIRGRATTFFNEELFELLRLIDSEKAKTDIAELESVHFTVQLPENDGEIRTLFEIPDDTNAVVFAPDSDAQWCKENQSACCILGTHDLSKGTTLLHTHDVQFVMLDLDLPQADNKEKFLNIEDIESDARDFLWFVREKHGELPVYLLVRKGERLSVEEQLSFRKIGVQGFIEIGGASEEFAEKLNEICEHLHQQRNINNLAKANKLVSYETGQRLSADGKEAEICLFDFEFVTAVDAEDAKNVLSNVSKPNVHFADIIGAEDAKKELMYFVEYLRNPKKYIGTGVSAPKGVMLYGPPGTGKTMLAKAMACEAGVTFLAAEGNQFLKKYVGEGPEAVHDLFRAARKYAPSILFVDEIDAIAKQRTGSEQSESREEILTAFLTEMDGFKVDPTKPVFVLAATNFDVEPGQKTSLDGALMRRFDRRICVDLPNKEERIRFLSLQFSKNPAFEVSPEMTENISVRSTGMSLASLASVIELSLRMAIREGNLKVTDAVFEEAFETFNSGDTKQWDPIELKRTARHEAGHAFLSWLSGDKPSYLTIVARSNHGGYMQHGDNESKSIYTRDDLLARIRTALGGRAAEIVYYGEKDGLSTGASGDLSTATNIAKRMICTYGMDSSFGLAVISPEEATALDIHAAVNRILSEEMAKAIEIISENKNSIDALVDSLLSANRLTGSEIDLLLSQNT